MEKNLYIDASHPNETRVVLKSNDKIEDKSENCSCKIMGVKIPKIIVNSRSSELAANVKIKLNKMRYYA